MVALLILAGCAVEDTEPLVEESPFRQASVPDDFLLVTASCSYYELPASVELDQLPVSFTSAEIGIPSLPSAIRAASTSGSTIGSTGRSATASADRPTTITTEPGLIRTARSRNTGILTGSLARWSQNGLRVALADKGDWQLCHDTLAELGAVSLGHHTALFRNPSQVAPFATVRTANNRPLFIVEPGQSPSGHELPPGDCLFEVTCYPYHDRRAPELAYLSITPTFRHARSNWEYEDQGDRVQLRETVEQTRFETLTLEAVLHSEQPLVITTDPGDSPPWSLGNLFLTQSRGTSSTRWLILLQPSLKTASKIRQNIRKP